MEIKNLIASGGRPQVSSRFFLGVLWFLLLITLGACSLFSSRPVQEMSDTLAAIKAAKEVQADTLAPDLYRRANEWFFRAKHEYKFKNFYDAKQYALKARHLAEQAEFEGLRSGGNRDQNPDSSPPPVLPMDTPAKPDESGGRNPSSIPPQGAGPPMQKPQKAPSGLPVQIPASGLLAPESKGPVAPESKGLVAPGPKDLSVPNPQVK